MKGNPVRNPPNFWPGVCLVAVGIVFLLIIRFGQSPAIDDFWPSIIIALIPSVGGIVELIRYLRYRKHKKAAVA